MADSILAAATSREPQTAEQTMSVVAGPSVVAGRTLAVCERSQDRSLHLCRERTVGVFVETDDGKRKRDRAAGTEQVFKPTSDVADIAHALADGLLS